MRVLLCLLMLLTLGACDDTQTSEPEPSPPPVQETKPPKLVLTPAQYSDLPKWGSDQFENLGQAFARSCLRIMKNPNDKPFGKLYEAGTFGDWQKLCREFSHQTKSTYKTFFEESFSPYQISADEEPVGLFTGYYEASLKGSYEKSDIYNIPLHKRPNDLVMVHLGNFREDLKGVRIAGRVKGGTLKPYETRADIVAGKWLHEGSGEEQNEEVLIWVDSSVDAFFVQIQGSGIVELEDGETVRIGYAGQNGHPYYAIGRELVKIGALTKKNVSMQSIRRWLEQSPDKANDIMNTNKSYVFFRSIEGQGPLGAEGVALTPLRSMAVDRTLIPYGMPLWVEIEPSEPSTPGTLQTPALHRIMIAQDTGGAITGPVRADIFWGYGKEAEGMAGIMNTKGRYWALLPKSAASANTEKQ